MTSSDDSTVRVRIPILFQIDMFSLKPSSASLLTPPSQIHDLLTGATECTMTGHGSDVRWVDWHPTRGVVASCSKDHQVWYCNEMS